MQLYLDQTQVLRYYILSRNEKDNQALLKKYTSCMIDCLFHRKGIYKIILLFIFENIVI